MGELQAGILLVEVAEGVHGDIVADLVAVQVPTLAVVAVLPGPCACPPACCARAGVGSAEPVATSYLLSDASL